MASIIGQARRTHNADPTKWLSPVITKDERVEFTREESGTYRYQKNGKHFSINSDELEASYVMEGTREGWQIVHEGVDKKAYPAEAAQLRKRAIELGIDKWLNWDFQMDDLIEATMKPSGCVLAWQQACGKSRFKCCHD